MKYYGFLPRYGGHTGNIFEVEVICYFSLQSQLFSTVESRFEHLAKRKKSESLSSCASSRWVLFFQTSQAARV